MGCGFSPTKNSLLSIKTNLGYGISPAKNPLLSIATNLGCGFSPIENPLEIWLLQLQTKLEIGRYFNSDRESEVSPIYVRIHKLSEFSNLRKYVILCNLRICDRAKLVKCTNKVGMGRFSNHTENLKSEQTWRVGEHGCWPSFHGCAQRTRSG